MYKNNNSIVYFRFFDNRKLNLDLGFRKVYYLNNCYSLLSNGIYRLRLWSTHKLQNSILRTLKEQVKFIKDDDYILCPIYGTEKYFSEFQFGATETRKNNETSYNCLKRCLGEELGIRINSEPENVLVDSVGTEIYCFNILDPKITKLVNRIEETDSGIDNKVLSKVASIIYGSEKNILKFLDTENILRDENSDNIVGIASVKYSEAKKFFN